MNDENENIMSFSIDNIFNKKQSNTLLVSADKQNLAYQNKK